MRASVRHRPSPRGPVIHDDDDHDNGDDDDDAADADDDVDVDDDGVKRLLWLAARPDPAHFYRETR